MNQVRIKLTDELLEQVVGAVVEKTGNVVGQKQVSMIESRLTRRALSLGLTTEAEYLAHFKANREDEIANLIPILTVHHTYFFREFAHFEFIQNEILPSLIAAMKKEGRKKIRVWSAASSRGQEAYSLFMFIDQYLKIHAPGTEIEIVGTDIDHESVRVAENGVYAWKEVKEIPLQYLSAYWVRGTGDISEFAKIRDVARRSCSFKTANLMETNKFAEHGKFDLIFCRNVFIYFQNEDVQKIATALSECLTPGGYFFTGLSESLSVCPKGLVKRGPSVYGPAAIVPPQAKDAAKQSPAVAKAPAITRVVCVDDSPLITKLMNTLLTKEHGFEIVGTAVNGLEAQKLVKSGLKFDVMTLDIHMPEMTGIEYLRAGLPGTHAPVIMLTSASRENKDLSQEAMDLGAKDYIEKPSLADLTTRADEIRSKIRLVATSKLAAATLNPGLEMDRSFKTSMAVKNTSNKANVVFLDERNWADLATLLRDRSFVEPGCILALVGDTVAVEKMKARLSKETWAAGKMAPAGSGLVTGKVSAFSIGDFLKNAQADLKGRIVCYSALCSVSRIQWDQCPRPAQLKILLAENVDRSVFLKQLSSVAVMPPTSFAYTSSEFFGKCDQGRKSA